MPRKAKPKTEPEAKPVEATSEEARGSKTAIIRDALKAHPRKQPKDIVALLKEQGVEVTNAAVSMVKFNMKAKRRKKKAAPAPEAAATPAIPKDAVSLGLLKKARNLAAQLGGIKEAKQAIDALAQLMD